jgi:hypothetical protein
MAESHDGTTDVTHESDGITVCSSLKPANDSCGDGIAAFVDTQITGFGGWLSSGVIVGDNYTAVSIHYHGIDEHGLNGESETTHHLDLQV